MLTNKEIKHIAKLARIKLTEKEEQKFGKELASILDFIGQLNKADTSQVEPEYQINSIPQDGEPAKSITGLANSFRTDEYRKDFEMNEELNEKLIGQAPHKENRFIKVKPVLNKSGK